MFGDPTFADAILDRLVHNAHRLTLKGDSLRKRPPSVRSLTTSLPTDLMTTSTREPASARRPGSSESPAGFNRYRRPPSRGIPGRLRRNAALPYPVPQKVYRPVDELQTDLDGWIREYPNGSGHIKGAGASAKTPMQIFLDAMPQDESGAKTRRPRRETASIQGTISQGHRRDALTRPF